MIASERGHYETEELLLSIAFMADTARIGEVAVVSPEPAGSPVPVGRLRPGFSSGGEGRPGRPLGDQHISRQALEMAWQGR